MFNNFLSSFLFSLFFSFSSILVLLLLLPWLPLPSFLLVLSFFSFSSILVQLLLLPLPSFLLVLSFFFVPSKTTGWISRNGWIWRWFKVYSPFIVMWTEVSGNLIVPSIGIFLVTVFKSPRIENSIVIDSMSVFLKVDTLPKLRLAVRFHWPRNTYLGLINWYDWLSLLLEMEVIFSSIPTTNCFSSFWFFDKLDIVAVLESVLESVLEAVLETLTVTLSLI